MALHVRPKGGRFAAPQQDLIGDGDGTGAGTGANGTGGGTGPDC